MPPDPSERFSTPLLITVRDPNNPEPYDRRTRAWAQWRETGDWEPLYEAGVFARPRDTSEVRPENADEPPGPTHGGERVTPLRDAGDDEDATG